MFSLLQITKGIKFFNGKNGEDINNVTYIQDTSFVSYIIIKGIILFFYDEYLEYLNQEKSYDNYVKLYKKLLSPNYIQKLYVYIDNFFEILNKINYKDNKFILKTLRMTAFG